MGSIELEDVTKVYRRGPTAVSHLDLEIADGEFFVLVGPSGCGKTTVLRMVAGLEDVTEGTIRLDGQDVTEASPRDRDIAMVFQNYALYPHLDVYENIAFGLRNRRTKKTEIDRRVKQAAEILDLTSILKKRPGTLSGGQRQRVAMGRAIVRQPKAFLMDEPLSNLDAKLRIGMRAELARIQREVGTTTLYVTHDQLEAMTLGDRVAVLREGVVQQVGTPAEVYRRPGSLFVAGFIGTPPMNLAEATFAREDGVAMLRFGPHAISLADGAAGRAAGLAGYEDRPVIVGIRPEDLRDAALHPDAPAGARLTATVSRLESMGPDAYLHFDVGSPVLTIGYPDDADDPDDGQTRSLGRGNRFVARLDERSVVRPGGRLELVVNLERLHVFDPATGEALARP